MSSYFEEECKQDYNKYSFTSEDFDLENEDQKVNAAFPDETVTRAAFDISIERYDSQGDELPLEAILDDVVQQINEQQRGRENHLKDELQYFNSQFRFEFEQDASPQNIHIQKKGSLIQQIRDSVELKKHKSFKSARESIQDAITDTSKLNTTQHSFFDSHRIHDLQLPIKRGYLLKKSPTIFQGFQKRYCTLDNLYFNYFLPNNLSTIFGSINLQIIEINIEEIRDPSSHQLQEFKLIPSRSDKIFHFKSVDGNSQSLEEWVSAIKQHIEQTQYFLYRYKTCKLIKQFWKYPQISDYRFKQECDTGDIVLFKNKNIGSTIQRTLTTSEYDHVALVLKYKCGKIVLFDSNTKNGVNLIPWEQLASNNWENTYEKKLHFKRTQQQIQGFFEFMKSTLGKQFNMGTKKLLKSGLSRLQSRKFCDKVCENEQCQDVDRLELSDLNDKEETFFCSQLVASCYQHVKLLPSDIRSDSYWPVDFSEKKKLNFLQKAYLSCEFSIIQQSSSTPFYEEQRSQQQIL